MPKLGAMRSLPDGRRVPPNELHSWIARAKVDALVLADSHCYNGLLVLSELMARAGLSGAYWWKPASPFVLEDWRVGEEVVKEVAGATGGAPGGVESGGVESGGGKRRGLEGGTSLNIARNGERNGESFGESRSAPGTISPPVAISDDFAITWIRQARRGREELRDMIYRVQKSSPEKSSPLQFVVLVGFWSGYLNVGAKAYHSEQEADKFRRSVDITLML